MEAKDPAYMHAMGQRFHPTFVDILMLNKFYQCEDVCEDEPIKCKVHGFPNPKNCAKCICPSGFGGDSCDELPGNCGEILKTSSSPQSFEQYVGSQQEMMHYNMYPPYGHFSPQNFGQCQHHFPSNNGQYILPTNPIQMMPVSSNSFDHFPTANFTPHQQHANPFDLPPPPPPPGFNFFPGFLKRRRRNNNVDYGQGMEECHWHIEAPPGNRIKLTVTSLTAFCVIACDNGFVEIKIRKDLRPTGIRLCCTEDLNENGQLTLYSESNLIVVSLYSKIGQVGLTMQYSHVGGSIKLPSSLVGSKAPSLLSRKIMFARSKLQQLPSSLLASPPNSILSGHGKTLATSLMIDPSKASQGAKTKKPSSLVNNSLMGKRSGGGMATSLLANSLLSGTNSGKKLPSSLLADSMTGKNGMKKTSMPSSLLVDGKNKNAGKTISLLADSMAGTKNNGNLYASSLVANNSTSGRRKGVPSLLKIETEKGKHQKFVPSLLEKIDETKKK